METRFVYLAILIASLAGPLALSFDKRVAFSRKWKYLFPAMLLPAALYIAWDIYFTSKGVWRFNADYITGIRLYNLPFEEVLFFFVVPYCCLFIYECIRVYFRNIRRKKRDEIALKLLAVLLIIAAVIFRQKMYTSWTFAFLGLFIFFVYVNKKFFRHFDATSFIISYSVTIIPFMVVNGFLTSLPVVIYNADENLGFRISTIPFEDVFYGMLLVMMNVVIYEKLKSKRRTRSRHSTDHHHRALQA